MSSQSHVPGRTGVTRDALAAKAFVMKWVGVASWCTATAFIIVAAISASRPGPAAELWTVAAVPPLAATAAALARRHNLTRRIGVLDRTGATSEPPLVEADGYRHVYVGRQWHIPFVAAKEMLVHPEPYRYPNRGLQLHNRNASPRGVG